MIIESLKKRNKELIEIEPVLTYLKDLESQSPIILSKWESIVFRDTKIDVKINHQIIRIHFRAPFEPYPVLFIMIFDEQDFLIEEITTRLDVEKKQHIMLHSKFDKEGKIIEKQYTYNDGCLSKSRERIINASIEEIDEIMMKQFVELSNYKQKKLLKKFNDSMDQAIRHIRSCTNFSYIIGKIEEQRDIKIAYQITKEKPVVLLKK